MQPQKITHETFSRHMLNPPALYNEADTPPSCSGYCSHCKTKHNLHQEPALAPCLALMQTLEEKKRIDLLIDADKANPLLSTDYLFDKARGQMFGVMVYQRPNGSTGTLRAFSGQYNGVWHVKGWVPPLVNEKKFQEISYGVEKEIKKLGRHIDLTDNSSTERKQLMQKRKSLSQKLMKNIHALYKLANFRGQSLSLHAAFTGPKGIPTGTGDCCAPKLLNYAATHGLQPLGLAEFYWGKVNKSGSRQHGRFYSSCETKCQPILGFMLCGCKYST